MAFVGDYVTSDLSLYIDGVLAETVNAGFAEPTHPTTPSSFGSLGASDTGVMDFFIGSMDEVRVTRYARSVSSINAEVLAGSGDLVTVGPEEPAP